MVSGWLTKSSLEMSRALRVGTPSDTARGADSRENSRVRARRLMNPRLVMALTPFCCTHWIHPNKGPFYRQVGQLTGASASHKLKVGMMYKPWRIK